MIVLQVERKVKQFTHDQDSAYFRCPCCLHWHHTDNASVVEPWMVNNSRNILFCARCFDAFERLVETDEMIANLHAYLDGAL